ncbi:IS5 family transposase [Corallococcus aberystwythensis]|uniref:IS5 family transposase n=1 Tax=Corallococcus aberystwythensis TaxID=2316722 RepID=UPI003F67B511
MKKDDGWRVPDELWRRIEPLLPARPEHPLGCHNPRVPDRRALDGILLVLRTGMQWGALKATGLCHPSSAYRRFREWLAAGVFREFWRQGLLAYDGLAKIDWRWLALDGTLGKAPLGGEKTGPNPTDRAKRGTKRSLLTDARGVPLGLVVAGANTNDFKLARSTLESIPVRRPLPSRSRRQTLCVDLGYAFRPVRELAQEYGFTLRTPRRRSQLSPKPMLRRRSSPRWVVERTHSWLNRFRRLLVRWEKREDTYVAMLHFALGIITWFHSLLPK